MALACRLCGTAHGEGRTRAKVHTASRVGRFRGRFGARVAVQGKPPFYSEDAVNPMRTVKRQGAGPWSPGEGNRGSGARSFPGIAGPGRPRPTVVVLGLLLLVGLLLGLPLSAQAHDERAVKAAMVFNLIKYVEWPQPMADNVLLVGFIGEPSVGEALNSLLAGKTSELGSVRVVALASDADLARCGVLYVSHASPAKARAAMEKVRGKNILTVGDSAAFARAGGMVGLVTKGDQVQIEINLDAVQAGGLRVSSRLLRLATLVNTAKSGN